jgi:transcription elongation factor GreA
VDEIRTTRLTREDYDQLKLELDELIANRPIRAGRKEQDKQEARIRQIQDLLRQATIGESSTTEGVAAPGMVLTVRYEGDDETEQFLLATREEAAHGDLEVYSPSSPLGQALLGAREGEARQYTLPNGDSFNVTLIRAIP